MAVEGRGDGGGGGVQYLKQIVIKHIQTYAKFNWLQYHSDIRMCTCVYICIYVYA